MFLVGCLQGGQRYQNGDTISASLCESCVCNQGLCEMSCHVPIYTPVYLNKVCKQSPCMVIQ